MADRYGTGGTWRAAAAGPRRLPGTAIAATVTVLIAACAGAPGPPRAHGKAAVHRPAVRLTITPGNGSITAKPDQGVTVAASHGKINNVTVTGAAGPVSGSLNTAGTIWHTTRALPPSRRYTVTATAVGPWARP